MWFCRVLGILDELMIFARLGRRLYLSIFPFSLAIFPFLFFVKCVSCGFSLTTMKLTSDFNVNEKIYVGANVQTHVNIIINRHTNKLQATSLTSTCTFRLACKHENYDRTNKHTRICASKCTCKHTICKEHPICALRKHDMLL